MKRMLAATMTAMLIVFGLFVIPSNSSASNKVINACSNTKTGALRIASKCSKSERPISWNSHGTQGLQGPPGTPGTPGAIGPAGLPGTSLVVLDANNNLVGYPLGLAGWADDSATDTIGLNGTFGSSYEVYLPNSNKILWLSKEGKPLSWGFLYVTTDCSGQAYLDTMTAVNTASTSAGLLYEAIGSGGRWLLIGDNVALPVTFRSKRDGAGACRAATVTANDPTNNKVYKFNPTTSPIPDIAGPIRLAVR
jgi:hypothetical protein